jgi:hypothetical protein
MRSGVGAALEARECSVRILLILCRQCVCAIFHQDEAEEDEQEDDISKSKNIKQKEVKSVASLSASKKGK